jgi:2-polyprenyl-3-methyl-5-hydroxy-6-metoxy-1,4-benzoquinol methylase
MMYDRDYYETGFRIPYRRDVPHWLQFFDQVALGIIGEFNPQTVLDCGCAHGFLVERLRERGVDAWGIDISEYAISQAHPSIAQFVGVMDVTQLPDRRFDVITCIEVLEHLTPGNGWRAVEAMTRNTDVILFSSTSTPDDEPTHENVQPFAYWRQLFAEFGFAPDASRTAAFVSHDAHWFVRDD